MNKTIYLYIFFLGTFLGSFYHVVGYRLPIGMNWVTDRSRCPKCETQLKWYELMPIFSFLFQRGKCNTCGGKIKPIYVLSEIVAGLLFVVPVLVYGMDGFASGQIFVAWAVLSMLIIITVSDIYYQLIPDKVLLFWGAIIIVLYSVYPQYSIIVGLKGALVGFFTLYTVGLLGTFSFKKEALGGGDIKLYAVLGFVLGIAPTFLSIFMASFIALVFILFFMKDKTKAIGFGPFIAIAAYICLFYGYPIINWYLNLF